MVQVLLIHVLMKIVSLSLNRITLKMEYCVGTSNCILMSPRGSEARERERLSSI